MSAITTFVLTGEAAQDVALAGGKAAALARLAAEFPVPPFFVLTADAFNEDGLLCEAADQFREALKALGPGPYAVRSSAREEDGAAAAHAGQFETELDVEASEAPLAAHRVWRSGFSETLAEYRMAQGLSGAPQPPAVLVQVMVKAIAAGVAFSVDPVSGDRDVVVISAAPGPADKLVGGEVDGDSYQIDASGGTLVADIVGDAPALSPAQRVEVARMARRAEAFFGRPQDIEWAFDERGFNLLQSRPITTLGDGPHGEDADGFVIWDNSNIVESYPGVVSPLTFSFARYVYSHVYQAFARLMGVPARKVHENRCVFENMLGRVDGRVYYNLLNWYRALALFPGFKANRTFMENMMGLSEALPQDLAEAIAPLTRDPLDRLLDNLLFVRVGAGLVWHELWLRVTIDDFYERLNAALATPDKLIDKMTATQLAAEYRRLEQKLLARWDAPLINDFLCMMAFGATQKVMQKWAGDDGLAFLSGRLIGQGDIISAEPARLIRQMGAMVRDRPDLIERLGAADIAALDEAPGLRRAFDAYLAKFGDRCTQELKLESRTLHDDPAQVLMAIAAAAAPRAAAEMKADARTLDDLIEPPLKRAVARRLLSWAKARVRDRENLRFERTRLFGRVRRIFLAMGSRLTEAGVLAAPRDVFHLTVDELLGAVEGPCVTSDLKALAALRAGEYAGQMARPDPPERFSVRGAHIVGVASLSAHAAPASDEGEVRKGLACCRGVVTGKVRVIEDPRTQALSPGEILVARHTDPGWIAIFANAAGVIAERGSLLSHSAIVAREMGVPCIVSLKGATQWLRTGDIVRLDGGAGTVERTGQGE